jgi:sugar (pentulose or hexulose) kinase
MAGNVYLAVDLGADSGRVMAAVFDGGKITLEEI